MSSTGCLTHLRFAMVAATTILLLSACGGGEPDPVPSSGVARPTADLSRLASVAQQCGVSALADLGGSGQVGLTTNRTTLPVADGPDEVVSYLASGSYFDTFARMDVLLALPDLRDPQRQPGNHTMGVAVTGPYLLGSIGCIKAVGKILVLDDNDSPASTTTAWAGMDTSTLPMDALLPRVGINGFQFVSNFTAENPVAVFDLPSESIHDPDDVHICHLESASTWHCVKASATVDGLNHRFSAPMSGEGVYVLATSQAND